VTNHLFDLEPQPLRVIVAGPRTWEDEEALAKVLDGIVKESFTNEITFVHGACPTGIDQMTADYCEETAGWYDNLGIQLAVEAYPADWDSCAPECPKRPHRVKKKPGDMVHPGKLDDYCPGAGPRRNRKMAQLGADRLQAFIEPCANPHCRKPRPHDSHGTAGMIRLCKTAGIPVTRWPR
jgi:hypothetical protein